MKLSEYMELVSSLTHVYRTEGLIEDQVSDGLDKGTLWRQEDYDWGVQTVIQTIKKHRDLLGIPGLRSETDPEERRNLMEMEISERAILEHMACVRSEVGSLLSGESKQKRDVVCRLLNDLSAGTDTNAKLGELFGKGEKVVLKSMQRESVRPDTTDTSINTEEDQKALLIQLKRVLNIK